MAKLLSTALGKIFGFSEVTRKERFRVQELKKSLEKTGPRNRDIARTQFVERFRGKDIKVWIPIFTLKQRKMVVMA